MDFGEGEFKQGLQEHVYRVDVRKSATKAAILNLSRTKSNMGESRDRATWLQGFSKSFWTSRKALKLRIRTWRFMQAVRNSSHLRHALKAAVGVAILTFSAFLPAQSAGMSVNLNSDGLKVLIVCLACKWFTSVHGQWATIRYKNYGQLKCVGSNAFQLPLGAGNKYRCDLENWLFANSEFHSSSPFHAVKHPV